MSEISRQPDARALSRANMEAQIRRTGGEPLSKPSLKGLTGKELSKASMLRIAEMVAPQRLAKAAPSSGTANMRAMLARQGLDPVQR